MKAPALALAMVSILASGCNRVKDAALQDRVAQTEMKINEVSAIHIPKLRAMLDGVPFCVCNTTYQHPPEQTAVETGVMDLFLKRIHQASAITTALTMESAGRDRRRAAGVAEKVRG